jgi:protein-tyrosine phosphatase
MFFSDIHTHILYGTDDGAKTLDDMLAMVKTSYEDGTRLLCLTPHFFPSFFGDNHKQAEEAFAVLDEYCKEHYPDLKLIFGNELGYRHDGISWIQSGFCRPMGNTNYILVEFNVTDSEDQITEGVYRLQNAGYIPIIAHAERYKNLSVERMQALRNNGVLIQINAESVQKVNSIFGSKKLKNTLKKGYVDFVASDAHNLTARPPQLKKSYEIFAEKFGEKYAKKVYYENALKIFSENGEGK